MNLSFKRDLPTSGYSLRATGTAPTLSITTIMIEVAEQIFEHANMLAEKETSL